MILQVVQGGRAVCAACHSMCIWMVQGWDGVVSNRRIPLTEKSMLGNGHMLGNGYPCLGTLWQADNAAPFTAAPTRQTSAT